MRHPREELAALAVGALEPDEAASVRAHVDGCAECRTQLAKFEELPPLLDLVPGLDVEPIPTAPAALEGAVLASIDEARRTAPRRHERRLSRPRWPAPAWAGVGAAAAVAVLAAFGALGGGGGDDGGRSVSLGSAAQASLRSTGTGTRVALKVSDLPPTRAGQVYELWFSRGRDRVSAGTFTVGADGRATAELHTAVPVAETQRLWITREPNTDDPAPNGPTVARTRLA